MSAPTGEREEPRAFSTRLGAVPPPPDKGAEPFTEGTPPIDGYRVIRQIGRGGMGVVYEAVQLELNRSVALKILPASWFADAELRERFRGEAAALARLQHPNIVQIFDVGEAGGRPFLALELMSGGSMADRLRDKPLASQEAAAVVETLARTMQHAHDCGIIHRDLKPANILVASEKQLSTSRQNGSRTTDNGPVKITDFGMAKILDRPGATHSGEMLGTPCYMAPEQASEAGEVTAATDVYALGAILYECLTGRPPFMGVNTWQTLEQVRGQEPVSLRRLAPDVSRDLETICLKCLEKAPLRRYGTAAALADDLQRYLNHQPVTARPVGPITRSMKWARRKPALASLCVVLIVAVGFGLAGLLIHESQLRFALDVARAEKERADTNYREARSAFQRMLARFDDNWYQMPRAIEFRNAQYEDALRFFAVIIAKQNDPDPEVRLDVARTQLQVAQLQQRLGRAAESETNGQAALQSFTDLTRAQPGRFDYAAGRAECLTHLGVGSSGGPENSKRLLGEAVAIYEQLLSASPGNFEYRVGRARALHGLGDRQVRNKDWKSAREILRREEDIWQNLLTEAPNDRSRLTSLANVQLALSLIAQILGPRTESEKYFHAASATYNRLLHDDPRDGTAAVGLSQIRVNWAYMLLAENQDAEALSELEKNVPLLEPFRRDEPNMATYRQHLLNTHGVMATIYSKQSRLADAVSSYERVVALADPARKTTYECELTRLRAKAGDHAGAAKAAAELAARPGVVANIDHATDLVSTFAYASQIVAKDETWTADERATAAANYIKQAAELIRRVRREVSAEQWPTFRPRIRDCTALKPIKDHPDIVAALKD